MDIQTDLYIEEEIRILTIEYKFDSGEYQDA